MTFIRLLSAVVILSLIGVGGGFVIGSWRGDATAAMFLALLFVSTIFLGLAQLYEVRKRRSR